MTEKEEERRAEQQEGGAEATAPGAMKAIGKDTVHRLCSGQVIIDLATTVKELLENSLDAGSTQVDIRMKGSGLGGITVADNGYGIGTGDHVTLCRKHWTSKISSFDDLAGVSTFGFRGEALSSLCAVATVTVTTATSESAPMGTQLEYDGDGELATQTPVARERGTTVQLANLFAAWPVRLQDLRKNIRREYMRTVALVEQYAIICDGVRLTLTNQSARGVNVVSVRMPLQTDRLVRLGIVLGTQMRQHLVHFEHRAADDQDQDQDQDLKLSIDGYISKPTHEAGRSASDKQYFFVNGRPCDFAKAKRVVNELFRAHCPSRFPVFAIAISINAATVDVNLTPDKRTLLIRHEQQLLETLRTALTPVVQPSESVYAIGKMQQVLQQSQQQHLRLQTQPDACPDDVADNNGNGYVPRKRPPGHQGAAAESAGASVAVLPRETDAGARIQLYSPDVVEKENDRLGSTAPTHRASTNVHKPEEQKPSDRTGATTVAAPKRLPSCVVDVCKNREQKDQHDWGTGIRQRLAAKRARTAQQQKQQREEGRSQQQQTSNTENDTDDTAVRDGGIANAKDPAGASSALSRLIHKSDFSRMQVVGQFNRGFIIARLDHDLYIIDQHASDEKYNFEVLQQRAVIASQPLIRPEQLELSVVDEAVAVEHSDALMRSGFHLRVDETQEPGRRVSLLSQPFIDQTLFDHSDLLELIGKLCVAPESSPRCERARRMFASRACRKSTMIGDPLALPQMRAIVRHLSSLDHPWNCPHGRPTMRHLFRLSSAPSA
ncbi:ATP-binding mismatch repair protein [Coemansia sp. RSA 1200]|nr:ATP-binding mismatch repair protein [Coemansia sp. RSA 1200]